MSVKKKNAFNLDQWLGVADALHQAHDNDDLLQSGSYGLWASLRVQFLIFS